MQNPRPLTLRFLSLVQRALHRATGGRYGTLERGKQGPQGRALALITRAHVRLYRATSGLIGSNTDGLTTLLLTTTGRKSGLRRTVPLPYFPCKDGVFVVASFAGNENHPAWYTNLRAAPEVTLQIRAQELDAVARTAEGEERRALWSDLMAMAPLYEDYQAVTAREIPLVILTPRPRRP